jgi:hypothetical protein
MKMTPQENNNVIDLGSDPMMDDFDPFASDDELEQDIPAETPKQQQAKKSPSPASANPIASAINAAESKETEKAKQGLFEKRPVYASAFGMETLYLPEFIEDKERLVKLVKTDTESLSILIGAVDNNRSRQLCHAAFQKSDNLIYIDSGNGEYTGQIVCGIKRRGRTFYKPLGDLYPDVLTNTDKFPTELSCAEASVSAPQSIVANIMASTVVVAYLYNILVLGSIEVRSVTFSTKTMNLKPVLTQKRTRKVA